MKALARSYIWWPKMDSEIEAKVRDCIICQKERKLPLKAMLHPWEWPGQPWYRVHIDYAGPIQGKWILVIVDAHSKYIEGHITASTASNTTISKLRQSFATHGLPRVLVSDNATSFTSREFQAFCQNNGIKHICSSAFHPASNGLAERGVQTVKYGIKKIPGADMDTRLYRFLARYRVTPQSTTGQAPAELLIKVGNTTIQFE
jgi:transposase InsO family protein